MFVSRCVAWFALGLAVLATACADPSLADCVIVLANANQRESLELAQHYAEKRAVPAENIIALPMSGDETISWDDFIKNVFQPLQDELVKRGWIDAIGSELRDNFGRKKYIISGHRISYLVVCRGVPLRVGPEAKYTYDVRRFGGRPEFRTNAGAVDSELSLLAVPNYEINALQPNPLFGQEHPTIFQETRVVKVSRLDGPSFADAEALVDHALEAEKFGLIGRAYVDIGGPIPSGDVWFENVAKQLDAANFDLSVDRTKGTFLPTARFDAPALYFGWYAWNVDGPFNQPEFKFPPGAIALHLHSFSAQTLNATREHWTGPLIARGVTATVGNVFEPYLDFTHRPDVLVHALLAGKNWGDAAYESLPALSWMTVTIGDPLYRPFEKDFAEQWSQREELPDSLYPYVILRDVRELEHRGQTEAAIAMLGDTMKTRPSAPIAMRWAELADSVGQKAKAARAASWFVRTEIFKPAELPLADEAAQFLERLGDFAGAEKIDRHVLALPTLSRDFRREFLDHAIQTALAAHDDANAATWREARSALDREN